MNWSTITIYGIGESRLYWNVWTTLFIFVRWWNARQHSAGRIREAMNPNEFVWYIALRNFREDDHLVGILQETLSILSD